MNFKTDIPQDLFKILEKAAKNDGQDIQNYVSELLAEHVADQESKIVAMDSSSGQDPLHL